MFSQRLKELRQKNKMTQEMVAVLTGLSPSTIGMYEQGRREPDSQTLKKFGAVFGVTTDYLLENIKQGPNDVEQAIEVFKESLKNSEGLMFKGVPLTDDDIDRLSRAIEISARIVLSADKNQDEDE